jgi:hypothetical protein
MPDRALLAICLWTGHLWYPHYGGPEVREMLMSARCEKCQTTYWLEVEEPKNPLVNFGNYTRCQLCKAVLAIPKQHADFKFGGVANLAREYDSIRLTSGATEKPATTFARNMDRVLVLGKLPEFLIFQSEWSRGLTPHGDIDRHEAKDPPKVPGPPRVYHIEHNVHFDPEQFFKIIPSRGTSLAVEGLLSSMLLGTWTAFEALAGDLWESAVNAHPDCVIPADPPGRKALRLGKRPQSKSIELWDVRDHGYDLRGKVGTVLKGTANFTNLAAMQEEYRSAFRNTRVNKVLAHESIESLQLLRNNFVHKGGLADAEFVDRAKDHPDLHGFRENEPIPLDGEFVERMISPVIRCSLALIRVVDRWVTRWRPSP